jgi:hypothetical protein
LDQTLWLCDGQALCWFLTSRNQRHTETITIDFTQCHVENAQRHPGRVIWGFQPIISGFWLASTKSQPLRPNNGAILMCHLYLDPFRQPDSHNLVACPCHNPELFLSYLHCTVPTSTSAYLTPSREQNLFQPRNSDAAKNTSIKANRSRSQSHSLSTANPWMLCLTCYSN